MLYLRHQLVLDVIGTFAGLAHFKGNFAWFHLFVAIPPNAI